MSRFIKTVRPDDGAVLEVSEKVFLLVLAPRGWTLQTDNTTAAGADKKSELMLLTKRQLLNEANEMNILGVTADNNKSEIADKILRVL